MSAFPDQSARDVARRFRWVTATVYINRRRSMRKQSAGLPLLDTDLPIGTVTAQGLRWSLKELDAFASAHAISRRKGGRPRTPRPTPPAPAARRSRRSEPL